MEKSNDTLFYYNFAGFVGAGLNFSTQQRLMWYILFVVYAPYAMLPLPLRWCVLAGSGTALTHTAMTIATLVTDSKYVRIFFFFSISLLIFETYYGKLFAQYFCNSKNDQSPRKFQSKNGNTTMPKIM